MSPRARRALIAWAPACFYMGLIWTLSSLTLTAPTEQPPHFDKVVHFFEYGGLALLVSHACFRTWPRHSRFRTGALAVLITVLWGWLDEIHQAFVPGRSAEVLDLVADTAGAFAGATARAALHLFTRARTAER